jgi:toxin ParE1/3/4
VTTPLRLHPEARDERQRVLKHVRSPDAAARFRAAVDRVFDRIEENPSQFPEHGLLVVQNGRALFYAVRRAVVPRFPYVVLFYVRRGVAIVLAIAHGRRRPGYWSERR